MKSFSIVDLHATFKGSHLHQTIKYNNKTELMFTFFLLRTLARNRYLSYQQRRKRFICFASIYLAIFLAVGFTFLGLYLAFYYLIYLYIMIVCFVYGTIEFLILLCRICQDSPLRGGAEVMVINNSMNPQYPLGNSYRQYYGTSPNSNQVKLQDDLNYGYSNIDRTKATPTAFNNKAKNDIYLRENAKVIVNQEKQ